MSGYPLHSEHTRTLTIIGRRASDTSAAFHFGRLGSLIPRHLTSSLALFGQLIDILSTHDATHAAKQRHAA